MQSKDLERLIASHSSRSASSLDQIGRVLRDCGLIPTGARGRNAPHLKPLHAANFLIAAAMARTASEACDVVKVFGELKCAPRQDMRKALDKFVGRPITFVEVLSALLSNLATCKMVTEVSLVRRPPHPNLEYAEDATLRWKDRGSTFARFYPLDSPNLCLETKDAYGRLQRQLDAEESLLSETIRLGSRLLQTVAMGLID